MCGLFSRVPLFCCEGNPRGRPPSPPYFVLSGIPLRKTAYVFFSGNPQKKREPPTCTCGFCSRARSPGRLPAPPPPPGWRMSRGGPGSVAALLHGMQTSPAEGRAATRAAASRRSGGRRTLLFLGPRCFFFFLNAIVVYFVSAWILLPS